MDTLQAAIFERVLRPLAQHYFRAPVLPEHMELSDVFFVKYSAAPGEQRELVPHVDGSIFSFNILLNDPHDFDGGGTWFESGGGRTVNLGRGAAVAHSGQARHSGVAISRGERYLLVGFVGCSPYPYCTAATAHAESDAFHKFGTAAWDRRPTPCVAREAFDPLVCQIEALQCDLT